MIPAFDCSATDSPTPLALPLSTLSVEEEGTGEAKAAPAGPPKPWLISAEARYYGEADLDDWGGDMEVSRFQIRGDRFIPFENGGMYRLGLGHEWSHYDFSGGALGHPDPFDDVTETTLYNTYAAKPADWGRWFAMLNATSGMDEDASMSDSFYLEGGAAWLWNLKKDLKLGFVVMGMTRLEEDPSLFLFPLVEWQINEQNRIGIIESTDPAVGWTYTRDQHHSVYAALEVQRRQYRIDDDDIRDAAFVDEQFALKTGWMWKNGKGLKTDIFLGIATRELEIDIDDDKATDDDVDPAGFIGINVSYAF